jgi:hypothetical protein
MPSSPSDRYLPRSVLAILSGLRHLLAHRGHQRSPTSVLVDRAPVLGDNNFVWGDRPSLVTEKTMDEKSLLNNRRVSSDPSDFSRLFEKQVLDPEQALMLAVLRNVIDDFQTYVVAQSVTDKKLFEEAEGWILEEDKDWFFSFVNICEGLDLDPDYIRQGLLCWKATKRKDGSVQKRRMGRAA